MLRTYRGEIILFFVTLIVASGWFFSKFSLVEFPPIGFIGARFFLAFLIFLPFAYKELRTLSRQQVRNACSVGLCYTIYLVLWLLGLIHSEHFGEGAFIVSLSMLIAPLFAWLFFKEPPRTIFWLSLPIATTGLYLLSSSKNGIHLSLGNLIFLSASLLVAIYFVLNNQFTRSVPVLSLTTLQVGIVGLCCGVYSLLFETFPETISTEVWLWFTASLLIATNLRMLIQTIGQKYCHVSNAAIIMILEPVWTLLLSILILEEQLSWQKAIGCFCIICALIIYRFPFSRFRSAKNIYNIKRN
ncbi:DMT family transporter [Actinobacillus arthritidis]|uniref:DMT family transporter n=1 Tax=Actinobacillus arthritidis TaxID=157339 RepID=UPI0024427B18|nr:DMT family transporter [Actinobacillus arthritidis]WGE88651.1 DMT family transporter [Actinobacillus arthritidis]